MIRVTLPSRKAGLLIAAAALALSQGNVSRAQDAITYTENFAAPVFDQIDQNGVDLVTGTWRVRTPVIAIGEGEFRQERGLAWTGKAWTHTDQPSIWRDDDKYIVVYKERSYEFNGFSRGLSKRAPEDGSTLVCNGTLSQQGRFISYCEFVSPEGDKILFGYGNFFGYYGPYYGLSAMAFGNIGMSGATVTRASHLGSFPPDPNDNSAQRFFRYSLATSEGSVADYDYNKADYHLRLGDQRLLINTPNNNDNNEHYLRPRNTTQIITDDFGNRWTYQVNDDRRLVRVGRPDGAGAISATYNDGKVKTITTPAGTWTYSYTTPGDYGTTTVTDPLGKTTYVKYHRNRGYVTEARDARGFTTYYNWNGDTRRLDQVTMPDGNYMTFAYDGRGNVTTKAEVAKGGPQNGVLTWRAEYAPSCTPANQMNCNQPRFVIDPRGNRTDFEYQDGIRGPVRIIFPAAQANAPRRIVNNEYRYGQLVRSKSCRTQGSCAGTSDEIVTSYGYTTLTFDTRAGHKINGSIHVLHEEKVTADGRTLLTCHQYDTKGNRVGTTPPNANITSCPTATVAAVAVTANAPVAGYARSAPTFPDATTGGGGGGGGGGDEPPLDPCTWNGTICP